MVVTVERMKDGVDGATIVSRLDVVEVGTDSDGDPISSCVVMPGDGSARPAPNRKLSDRLKLALDALTDAVLGHGNPAPAAMQLPAAIRVVGADRWRHELFRRAVLNKDDKNPRADFKRIRKGLAERSL